MTKPSIAIIGAGKVGSALGILLQGRGYPVTAVAGLDWQAAEQLADSLHCPVLSNQEAAARAELVFITIPDRNIASVATEIAGAGVLRPGQIVAHTSGACPAGELKGVHETGALAVSVHPLQSFAEVQAAIENLPGSYFALEGDANALPLAKQVVEDLDSKWFIISAADKPLYHAAACIASNYMVALMHFATDIYAKFGLAPQEAFTALYPLVQGTVANIAKVGPTQALTGPVARGDSTTIAGHIKALQEHDPQLLKLYGTLGQYTIKVALAKGGINSSQGEELDQIFRQK